MSSTDNPQPDNTDKPKKRRYDKRCKSAKSIAAIMGAERSEKLLGRKPKWMKHLSRNAAYEILQQFDNIVSPGEIYAWCWEHKKVELMVGMREYLWNRLEGRPFTAENPVKLEAKQQDPRMADAIAKLLPKPRSETAKTPVM